MIRDIDSILGDGGPVEKARLREFLKRHSSPALAAEGFGLAVQSEPLPVPDPSVRAANHHAIMAALAEAVTQGGGTVVLPAGFIHLDDTIEISNRSLPRPAMELTQIAICGMGRSATRLVMNHPTRPLLRLMRTDFTPGSPGFELRLQSAALMGRGERTAGNLIELFGWINHVLEDLTVEGTAGRGIQMRRAERSILRDVVLRHCRQALVLHEASNETYLLNVLVIDCGYTRDPLEGGSARSWSVNAGAGGELASEGSLLQSKRATVHIEAVQNIRWIGGSCKVLVHLAGVKCRNAENVQIDNVYFEGFPPGGPTVNPSVICGGAMERALLTEPIGADDRAIRVAGAEWFPVQFSTPDVLPDSQPVEAYYFAIYDPDRPSDYEILSATGFVGDTLVGVQRGAGPVHRLAARPARAWPRNSVLTELAFGVGDMCLHNNHLDGFHPPDGLPGVRLVENAREGHTNGQVIAGFTHDAFFGPPNFPHGDLPGVCHLELSGRNRVRYDRRSPFRTERVQVHHRAVVYLSRQSRLGGIEVAPAENPDGNPAWTVVLQELVAGEPVTAPAPGGFHTLRSDVRLPRSTMGRAVLERPAFLMAAPFGAVAECRLYSVAPDERFQGADYVCAFVLDLPANAAPAVSVTFLRDSGRLGPRIHVQSDHAGGRFDVFLEVAPEDAAKWRGKTLRFDATSLCGALVADEPRPYRDTERTTILSLP